MLLLGEIVTGALALEQALISRLAGDGDLDAAADEVLACLRGSAPIALSYVKEAVVKGADVPLEAGLRLEADLSALLQTTADRAEGVQAFAQRRQPRFTGR
jgi:enoyl-CoA hydratase/carnithine racemase